MTREHLFTCEGCGKKILEGDNYHSGSDVELCEDCAPDFAEILAHPDSFLNGDGEPMSASEAREIYDGHISAGGKPEDKLVSP